MEGPLGSGQVKIEADGLVVSVVDGVVQEKQSAGVSVEEVAVVGDMCLGIAEGSAVAEETECMNNAAVEWETVFAADEAG